MVVDDVNVSMLPTLFGIMWVFIESWLKYGLLKKIDFNELHINKLIN